MDAQRAKEILDNRDLCPDDFLIDMATTCSSAELALHAEILLRKRYPSKKAENCWGGGEFVDAQIERVRMKREELGVIEGVGYGCRDAGRPILWFGVNTLSGGSLQVLEQVEANTFLRHENIREVRDLDGKACVVETDGHTVKFLRLHK